MGYLMHCSREYLFQAMNTSESVLAEAYCHHHLCSPVRDGSGCAVAAMDFTMQQQLSYSGNQDVGKLMKLLSSAYHYISDMEAGKTLS